MACALKKSSGDYSESGRHEAQAYYSQCRYSYFHVCLQMLANVGGKAENAKYFTLIDVNDIMTNNAHVTLHEFSLICWSNCILYCWLFCISKKSYVCLKSYENESHSFFWSMLD